MAIYAMTGGATGIGAALKEQLREQGDGVIVVDIKDADIIADLSTPQGRQAAIDGIREKAADGLDGFIPCAGLGPHVPDPTLVARVNYFGVIATVEGVGELVAKKNGSICFVSSNSAPMIKADDPFVQLCLEGDEAKACEYVSQKDGQTAYAGSKRGLTIWMRKNVKEYASRGVRMNAVAPGITRTPLTDAGMEHEVYGGAMKEFEKLTPVGGSAHPGQIANAMRFLLSDEASFVCGEVLFADGGTDALMRPNDF